MKDILNIKYIFWIISLNIIFSTVSVLPIMAQKRFIDNEVLAGRISKAIHRQVDRRYTTLAISRIRLQDKQVRININELIDYTNVKIVRGRRFRVTDRSKLQLILKEQRIQLSDFVSPNEYKELGSLLGVQLFIYGNVYHDSLILKAIDVQTSAIVWAEAFTIFDKKDQYLTLNDLSGKMITSLQKDMELVKKEQIRKISFWSVEATGGFEAGEVMDYMMIAVTQEGSLSVVDRENLQLIYQEQKLNQAVFIDESQARKLGELYGVDAFVYGKISLKPDNTYLASLKMMSIYSGVIIWADLIKFNLPEQRVSNRIVNPFTKKLRKQLERNKGSDQVAIPGGVFIMGSNDPLFNSAPERAVRLRPFLIDIYEVSHADYANFVEKTAHRKPTSWKNGNFPEEKREHPVSGISWEDAKIYCQSVGNRLLTEAEWERAIRGLKGRKYPWNGTGFAPNFAVTRESGNRASTPVYYRNRDINPEGVMHLAGNVREYVSDIYKPYGSTGAGGTERVVRGASWAFSGFDTPGYFRGHTRPNLAWPDIGFRCGKDIQ